jgi:hypothetical protein
MRCQQRRLRRQRACTNTPGSFSCACNPGFTGDGVTCTDVDECATNDGGCDTNATCANTPGSFTCTCDAGYAGDGVTCAEIQIPAPTMSTNGLLIAVILLIGVGIAQLFQPQRKD